MTLSRRWIWIGIGCGIGVIWLLGRMNSPPTTAEDGENLVHQGVSRPMTAVDNRQLPGASHPAKSIASPATRSAEAGGDSDFRPIATDSSSTRFRPVSEATPQADIDSSGAQESKYPVIQVAYQEASRDTPPTASHEYKLSNLSCDLFEQRMIDVWGKARLKGVSEDDGRRVTVSLPTTDGTDCVMHIDRVNGRLMFDGPQELVGAWHQAMAALDVKNDSQVKPAVLDMQQVEPATIAKAVAVINEARIIQTQDGTVQRAIAINGNISMSSRPTVLSLPQQEPQVPQEPEQQNPNPNPNAPPSNPQQETGLIGTVTLEYSPELNLLVVKGRREDVAKVSELLKRLIASAGEAQPEVKNFPLQFVASQIVAPQIQTLYDNNFAAQLGTVTITAIEQPNSLIVIGPKDNLDVVGKLIQNIDIAPSENQAAQFKTIRLKYMNALDAKQRLDDYFAQQTAVGGAAPPSPVTVIADYRSNSIVIKAGSANLALAEMLVDQFDVLDGSAKKVVHTYRIKNAVAAELGAVLQDVLHGNLTNAPQGLLQQTQTGLGGGNQQQQQQQQAPTEGPSTSQPASVTYTIIDKDGKAVEGRIAFDVRVTADAGANAIIVSARKSRLASLKP